jgi:hypothetical protein
MIAWMESGGRLLGYLVLRAYDVLVDGLRDGRVVLVDRGPQYAMRYAVGWQARDRRGWTDGVLHADLTRALQTYETRCAHVTGHRGCRCHTN